MTQENKQGQSHPQHRRRTGATMGLIAACAIVLCILGIAVFLLLRLLGGEREAANATEVGALTSARQALIKPGVKISSPADAQFGEFYYLGSPTHEESSGNIPSHVINLLTYNRCVAQALLVAINAQQIGASNAGAVNEYKQLTMLGNELSIKLKSLPTATFESSANQNPLRMLMTSSHMSATDTTAAGYQYMKAGGSTNVYFYPNQFGSLKVPDSIQVAPAGALTPHVRPSPEQPPPSPYMRGYLDQSISGVGSFVGVPVFPQQKPHLVSQQDAPDSYNYSKNSPWDNTPPNSWKFKSVVKNIEGTSLTASATAAAIVGAANFGSSFYDTSDYAASIPGGYIAFLNDAANSANDKVEGSWRNNENIFNGLLGVPSSNHYGLDCITGANGSIGLFSKDPGALLEASLYYASAAANVPVKGQRGHVVLGPQPSWSQIYFSPGEGVAGEPCSSRADHCREFFTEATTPGAGAETQELGHKGYFGNCLAELESPPYGLTGSCLKWLTSIENTRGFGVPVHANPESNPMDWSNVDYMKSEVLKAFHSTNQWVSLSAGSVPPSGLGIYHFSTDVVTTNREKQQIKFGGEVIPPAIAVWPDPKQLPLQMTGTISQLINQVTKSTNANQNSCAESIYTKLLQLCNQIKPGYSRAELVALLQETPLPMGSTKSAPGVAGPPQALYIYLPKGDFHSQLKIGSYASAQTSNPNIERFTGSINKPGGPVCDGAQLSGSCYTNSYQVLGFMVDATNPSYGTGPEDPQVALPPKGVARLNNSGAQGVTFEGDDFLHHRPYQRLGEAASQHSAAQPTFSSSEMMASDNLLFVPNSGFGGLLGAIEFSNTVTGTTTFSRVN